MFLLAVLATLATLGWTHFVLEIPASVGYEDAKEGIPPCGGFDATSRDAVTEWPVAGAPLKLISTHSRSAFTIRAVLLSEAANGHFNFSDMVPLVQQIGLGALCLNTVPGIAALEGKDAILQVIQVAADGQLFQVRGVTTRQCCPWPCSCPLINHDFNLVRRH